MRERSNSITYIETTDTKNIIRRVIKDININTYNRQPKEMIMIENTFLNMSLFINNENQTLDNSYIKDVKLVLKHRWE